MKQKNRHWLGFTLVELVVSVGITAVLMLGMAAFFSSTFRSMFTEREKVAGAQGHTVVNAALQKRFISTKGLQEKQNDYVVLQNDTSDGTLPFTYIADVGGNMVFKDFFVFNGKQGSTSSQGSGLANPAGITQHVAKYYVAVPQENAIYQCNAPALSGCVVFDIGEELNQPMDITSDGTDIFITDAGNDRILKVEDPNGGSPVTSVLLGDGLNFPTGIAHYAGPSGDYLFVADTYNGQVKKVNASTGASEVVVGGNDSDCGPVPTDMRDHTASFCELNFPTGVVVGGGDLFIADTGNGRVLKVSDPALSTEQIGFRFGSDMAVGKIKFTDFSGESFVSSSMAGPGSLNGNYSDVSHELTPGSIFSTYNGPCAWNTSGNILITETDPSGFLSNGDLLAIEDGVSGTAEIYEATSVPSGDSLLCFTGAPPAPVVPHRAYFIQLNKNMVGVSNNKPVYLAAKNGNNETIDLDFSAATFPETGFQAIDIEVFDFDQTTSLETYQQAVRVGDGELGTAEDIVTVVPNSYDYPTGLGWSVGGLEVSDVADYAVGDFTDYDYRSDFEISSFTTEVLDFEGDLENDLLKLTFVAKLGLDPGGEPLWRDYSLSASLHD